jgi:hypothetical protein
MNRRLTRRSMGKLLAAVPAAFAAPLAALPAGEKKAAAPAFTETERKDIAKGQADLKKAMTALRKAPIPIGTEPAFVFTAPRKR